MISRSVQAARVLGVILVTSVAALLSIGCATDYATPGRGADLKALTQRDKLTDASISETLAKKPLAALPTGIAVVRIQAKDYVSKTAQTYGTGSYLVVTTRDIESDTDLARIQKLPMVSGIAPLSRLLLPEQMNSDQELRQAAASLHADMLLVYTIDSTFQVEDHLAPLTVVTLGLSPNMTAQLVTTASAVLMDTRNGYVYGYAEATEHGIQLTNGWMTDEAVNDTRRRTESRAFSKLVDSLTQTWGGVVKNINSAQSAPATQPTAAGAVPKVAGAVHG